MNTLARTLLTRVVFSLALFAFVGCKDTSQSANKPEEKNPYSRADEVRQIWEEPKGKASAAKKAVEDKDREIQRQLKMFDN